MGVQLGAVQIGFLVVYLHARDELLRLRKIETLDACLIGKVSLFTVVTHQLKPLFVERKFQLPAPYVLNAHRGRCELALVEGGTSWRIDLRASPPLGNS